MNPMSGILGETWRMYRTYARHLLTIAFVVYVVAALLEALLAGTLGRLGALLSLIVGIIAASLLQAALVKAVEDVRDGRADMSLGATLQAARPSVGRVAVASILAGIAIGLGLILFIAPGLFLLTIWCLIVPVLVLEGVSIGASFGRSRQLVRGFGWQVFGPLVAVFLVLIVGDIVIGLSLASLPDALRRILSGLISGTLVAPFLALVVTLAYFRLLSAQNSATGHG
ncbi:MAG: hypothetical protein ACR2JT_07305 [Nocardioidaceae bacterium]